MMLMHLDIILFKTDGNRLDFLRNFCVSMHPQIAKESTLLFNSNLLWEK